MPAPARCSARVLQGRARVQALQFSLFGFGPFRRLSTREFVALQPAVQRASCAPSWTLRSCAATCAAGCGGQLAAASSAARCAANCAVDCAASCESYSTSLLLLLLRRLFVLRVSVPMTFVIASKLSERSVVRLSRRLWHSGCIPFNSLMSQSTIPGSIL